MGKERSLMKLVAAGLQKELGIAGTAFEIHLLKLRQCP